MNSLRNVFVKVIRKYVDYNQGNFMNLILSQYNIPYTLAIYNLISFNSMNYIVNVLSVKFGMNPLLITLILAFIIP